MLCFWVKLLTRLAVSETPLYSASTGSLIAEPADCMYCDTVGSTTKANMASRIRKVIVTF